MCVQVMCKADPCCRLLPCRCLERIAANEAAGVGFANFIWACSEWGHRLRGRELEQLVPAAVDNICATWPEPGRGSALLLAEGLTRQVSIVPALCLNFEMKH